MILDDLWMVLSYLRTEKKNTRTLSLNFEQFLKVVAQDFMMIFMLGIPTLESIVTNTKSTYH